MNLRDTTDVESKMTVVGQEPSLDIRDFAGQPLCVGNGNHSVLFAVHEHHGNSNLTQFDPPGCDECDFIINHAIPSPPASLTNTAEHEIGKACG